MVIFDERGVQILNRNNVFYMRSDMGHFAEHIEEIEISKEDAEKIVRDATYADKVVCDYRNKKRGLV